MRGVRKVLLVAVAAGAWGVSTLSAQMVQPQAAPGAESKADRQLLRGQQWRMDHRALRMGGHTQKLERRRSMQNLEHSRGRMERNGRGKQHHRVHHRHRKGHHHRHVHHHRHPRHDR